MTIADLLRKSKQWEGTVNVCVVCRLYDDLQVAVEHARTATPTQLQKQQQLGAVVVTDSMYYLLRINTAVPTPSSSTSPPAINDVAIFQEDVVECITALAVYTAQADDKCPRDVSVFELRTFSAVTFFVVSDNPHHNTSGTTVEGIIYALHCMPVLNVERKPFLLLSNASAPSSPSAPNEQQTASSASVAPLHNNNDDKSGAMPAATVSPSPAPPMNSPSKGQQVMSSNQQQQQHLQKHDELVSQTALMGLVQQELEDRLAIAEGESSQRVDLVHTHYTRFTAMQHEHLTQIVDEVKKVNTTTVFVDAKTGLPTVAEVGATTAPPPASVEGVVLQPATDAAAKIMDEYEKTVRAQLSKYFTVTQKSMFEQCKKVERDYEYRHHVQAEKSWNTEREELYRNLRNLSEQLDHLTYSNEQLSIQLEEGRSRENAMLQRFRKRETELHQQVENLQRNGSGTSSTSRHTDPTATGSSEHAAGNSASVSASRSAVSHNNAAGKPKMFDFFQKR